MSAVDTIPWLAAVEVNGITEIKEASEEFVLESALKDGETEVVFKILSTVLGDEAFLIGLCLITDRSSILSAVF